MNKTNVFLGVVGLIGLLILGYSVWGIMNQVAGSVKTTEYGITYYGNGKAQCPRVSVIGDEYVIETINYDYPTSKWVVWVSSISGIHRKFVPLYLDNKPRPRYPDFIDVDIVGCDMKVEQTPITSYNDEYEDLMYVPTN